MTTLSAASLQQLFACSLRILFAGQDGGFMFVGGQGVNETKQRLWQCARGRRIEKEGFLRFARQPGGSFTAVQRDLKLSNDHVGFEEIRRERPRTDFRESRSLAERATAMRFSRDFPPSRIRAMPLETSLCTLKCRISMFSRRNPAAAEGAKIVTLRERRRRRRERRLSQPPQPDSLPCLRRSAGRFRRAAFLRASGGARRR